MTTPGAFFVWGPPGTGKTKVITAGVRAALAAGHTVLIASHTHVAVDNVLEGLVTGTAGSSGAPALVPGQVIRNVTPRVRTSCPRGSATMTS